MAEHITLAAYLNELATLLREESFNEVISHCRYILQHYPQNVETYRLLGQALLQRGQHGGGLELVNEAAEVFQRVLSVSPVDHVAHLCLSEIRETDGDLDQAIWHLERAYEQMSGNKELQAALRELYIKRGGEESAPEKIQLTRGALARQYASGQLYDQAIIELRAALDQMPGRVDLQVLLAQTLWDSQHPVEAAEVSVQILKKLPYCLPANCILAQLWLDNERPTDAQVFLDRITAVDPYEAMRILQPDVESADTNVLAHLDYSAQAAAALSSETPDWVHELGDLNESAGMDRALGVDTFGDSAPLDMGALFSEQSDSPPDWLAGDMSLPADTGSAAEQDDGLPNWFSDLDSQDTGSAPQGDDWLSPSEDDFGFGDWMSEQGADAPEGSGVAAEESQAEDVDIPEPTFEELFGSADDVPDAPAEVGSVPDWLGAAIEDAGVDVPGFEDVDMPEPAFEDLFGSVDDAPDAPAEAGSVPDWLGAAMEDAGGDVPEFEDADMLEPAFEDLFGPVDEIPDAPAEAGSVPDWLGAVMEEPEEAAPSGFTDLLAAYEAQHPAANQVDDVERAGEGMPPEWETALTGDDGKVVSSEPDGFERDDEAEFFAAFDEVAPEFDFGSAFAMPDEPSFDEEPETSFMTSELPGDDSGTVTPEELEALRLATMPPPDTDFSEFMEPEVPADVDFLAPAVEWSDRIAPPHAEQTELDEASIQTGQWVAESESMISEASTEIEEWVAGFEDVVSPPISAMPDSGASAEAEWAGMNDDTGEAAVDDWLDDLSVPDEAELFEPVPEVEQEIAPVPPVESASVGEEPTQLWVSEQVEEDPDWMPSGAPDDDWLGSFAKPPTGELFPGYEEPEESGVGMEDEWVSQEDDLTVGFTPTGEVDDMAPAHLDDVFDSVGGVEDGELGTIPDLVETFGSEEIEFAESGVSQADIFPDDEAPAWMADIAPIEMSTRSVLDSAYDPFEGGSADQVPEYRSASETGILQPDESPDWMMAFSDDDLPVDGDLESAAFGDEAVSLDDLDLGFDFGAAPDVVSRDKPITDSLADMTFDEPDDVESDSAELDEQALAAEGDGEMPDWLMAITSSESDQLEDTVWDEPDTYSSAEDTGVLQPSSQPDWLVDMTESPDEEAPLAGESGEVDVLLNNLFDDMDIDEAQGTPGLGKRMADAGDVVDADEDFFAALGAAAGDAGTDLDLDEMMAGVGDVGGDAVEISDADDDFFAALGAAAGDAEADLDLSEIMAGARDVADVAAVPDADEDFFAALEAADEDVEIGLDLGEIIADAAEADAEFFAALDAAEAQPGVAQPADLPHTKVVELDADDDFDDDLGDDDFGPGNFAFDGKQPAWLRKPKESDNAPLMADQGPAPESPEWLRDAFENDESDS